MEPRQALRKALGVTGKTQAEMAKEIGVKPQTLSQWLSGVRPIPAERAVQISNMTSGEVSLSDLCPGFPWKQVAA